MAIKKEQMVIEITEEAYKQNSVYRPWDEITANGTAANTGTSVTQQRALQVLAALKPGAAAFGNLR